MEDRYPRDESAEELDDEIESAGGAMVKGQ